MILFPHALYTGERLASCSDEARLHFPYIAGLVNGYARLRLSIPQILERAYGNFKNKPTKHQITAWVAEYRRNFLLYVYTSADGEVWGQLCGIPDNALPRYQTGADRKSPAPMSDHVAVFEAEYSATKRKRAEASENFVDLSKHFGNLPQASEECGTFPLVVDEDVVVDEVEILSSPLAPDSADSGSVRTAKDEEAKAVVKHVFAYFLGQTGRSESQYELTDKRMQVGIRAYRVCLRRCHRDPEKAQLAMAAAVDGLVANDWNMGRAPKSKRLFTEWIGHIFGTVETMEARWKDGGFEPNV